MKRVTVYCGAALGNDQTYQQVTINLGLYLVKHDLELVYGGGGVGLMGLLANEVLNAGGRVHGVMPKELVDRGAAFNKLPEFLSLQGEDPLRLPDPYQKVLITK